MKLDYHMHFEYGSYDWQWVKGFFEAAKARGLEEIGISEHTHGFTEFRELYETDLLLDDSETGRFQREWLKKNKFKCPLQAYVDFLDTLKAKGLPVKMGLEVCNFQDQEKVREILSRYSFDYVIGSVHFLHGWGFDASALKSVWQEYALEDLYAAYAEEVEKLAAAGLYDVLGHPFNLRLFGHLPTFDATPYLHRVAKAVQRADMAVDVNTGTKYRYPIGEISPYPEFMAVAKAYGLKIITSSDAHAPEDCGRYIDEAVSYAARFGYTETLRFTERRAECVPLG